MSDTVTDILNDIFEYLCLNVDPVDFENLLAENGLMIAPTDDPTNLFGPLDDS